MKMYKLNTKSLFSGKRTTEREAIELLREKVRALYYLIEVIGISISDDIYQKIDDDGKKYFKATEDNN